MVFNRSLLLNLHQLGYSVKYGQIWSNYVISLLLATDGVVYTRPSRQFGWNGVPQAPLQGQSPPGSTLVDKYTECISSKHIVHYKPYSKKSQLRGSPKKYPALPLLFPFWVLETGGFGADHVVDPSRWRLWSRTCPPQCWWSESSEISLGETWEIRNIPGHPLHCYKQDNHL